MTEKYRVSRELGRSKKEQDPPPEEVRSSLEVQNTEVENVEVKANFFWLNAYLGSSTEAAVVKSDLQEQINKLQNASGKAVVGLGMMEDSSVMLLLED